MVFIDDYEFLILFGFSVFSFFLILLFVITFWHDNEGNQSILDREINFSSLKKKLYTRLKGDYCESGKNCVNCRTQDLCGMI